MTKEGIDALDRKILYELDFNSRMPNSVIAKKLRTSKEMIHYRIRKMLANGTIRSFYAVLNSTKLGFMGCRFLIKFRNTSPEKEQEIISYFVKKTHCWWAGSIEGAYDLGVAYWLPSLNEFHSEKIKFMEKFGDFVKVLEEAAYVNIHVFRRTYLSGKTIGETVGETTMLSIFGSATSAVRLDAKDKKLLGVLSQNAKAPVTEIAQKTKMSVGSVIYRLKLLEKNRIILACRPLIDLSRLGRYWYKVNLKIKDFTKIKEMLAFFSTHPDAVYAYQLIGGADLEVEFEARNYEHFIELIKGIKNKFGNAIESHDHYLWYKEHKLTFSPAFF